MDGPADRTSTECYDAVAPAGARVVVDQVIGVCLVHAWWFGVDGQHVIACPEPGCEADVQLYDRGMRVGYLGTAPQQSSEQTANAPSSTALSKESENE